MAFSYIGADGVYVYASGTSIATYVGLHVEVGDILCVTVGWLGADTPVTVATDAGDNFTMLTQTTEPGCTNTLGWCVVAHHSEGAAVTGTLTAAREKRCIAVMQFRPDSGETVSLVAGPSAATGQSNAAVSGNISPSGSDMVVFSGVYSRDDDEHDNWQIADSAVDGYQKNTFISGMYKLFTSNQTDIHGQITMSYTPYWVCDILALNSSSGGASMVPVVIQHYAVLGE